MIMTTPNQATCLTLVSLALGMIVMLGVGLATLLGALWAISYGIVLFFSHTSSVQLMVMLIVGYEAYRIGQSIKRSRRL